MSKTFFPVLEKLRTYCERLVRKQESCKIAREGPCLREERAAQRAQIRVALGREEGKGTPAAGGGVGVTNAF